MKFYIYAIRDDGSYDKPKTFGSVDECIAYAYPLRGKFNEFKIVDEDDFEIFHVKDDVVLNPINGVLNMVKTTLSKDGYNM